MSLECLCVKKTSGKVTASAGIMKAKLSCSPSAISAKMEAVGSLVATALSKERVLSAKVEAEGSIKAWSNSDYFIGYCEKCDCCEDERGKCYGPVLTARGEIKAPLTVKAQINTKLEAKISGSVSYTDKFAGDFSNTTASHKMYPKEDVSTSGFVTETMRTGADFYTSIDEGVFTGSYHVHGGSSRRVTDDNATFIQPSAINTNGSFFFKCEVTNPTAWLKDSRLHMRAAAPVKNYESNTAPEYLLHNIRLEDPSGDLITQYEDIKLRGDADYYRSDGNIINYATYSSKPKNNPAEINQWASGFPRLWETGDPSGYTLSFDLNSTSLDDPFDVGFNPGFEDTAPFIYQASSNTDHLALDGTPLSTRSQRLLNPTPSIRISAIEISNHSTSVYGSGTGPAKENSINMYVEVTPTGNRLERKIKPIEFKTSSFDTTIYPEQFTTWSGYNIDTSSEQNNTTTCSAEGLKNILRNYHSWEYVSLDSIPASEPSGKMILKFGHESPHPTWGFINGAFSIGLFPSGPFDTAYEGVTTPVDHFFEVDSISLKILARKAAGAADYPIDVVGYSDDGLLHITPAVGGFLQNSSADPGSIPSTSGFDNNHFALDGEAVSDRAGYFNRPATASAGGDHYKVGSNLVTNTGSFQWYEVPLKITEDLNSVGRLKSYNQSTYFENLILDICPLTSGAQISSIELSVKYTPSNALQMYTVGGEDIGRIQKTRSEGKFYPTSRQASDAIINAGSGYAPLSTISGIPQAYTTPATIKSNYSRRWRGMEGTVNGPYNPNQFAFGFENPLVDFPFLSGYYDFDYDDGLTIKSRPLGSGLGALTGTMSTTYDDYRLKNEGWRFTTGSLFSDKLTGYSSPYKTTDWTALSNGGLNFKNHELYGQIADAFNNVVRISGDNSNINFGQIDTASGFSIFARFSPDYDISGVNYNLWNSGVIVSKWDTGKDLEFALAYDDGYLCGYAQDHLGNTIKVKDTIKYNEYQYPLSVILTYNDHKSSGLKLYTDNEFSDGAFTNLRASSSAFTINTDTNNLVLGYSSGSGVGINAFVSEFGVSTYGASGTNIVEQNPDLLRKEVTAQKFLENHRLKFWDGEDENTDDTFKLWDYVDEDTEKWDLGAFKYCHFGPDFNWFTKRVGRDLISFNIVHEGSGYSQKTDISEPSALPFSGIAYHTQVENDFLRFNLSDSVDSFYSVSPRISKSLPRGYKFKEDAIVVDTILEHSSSGNIVWDDCQNTEGAKLIVSLYTRHKDKHYSSSYDNFGLINRSVHYLTSGMCFERLESKFDFDTIDNKSEAWALFPSGEIVNEFNHKYFSEDIDKMFLQYDLVYPSGSEFSSRINIHSAHVRLTDPFINYVENNNNLNLSVSGEKRPRESLNLAMRAPVTITQAPTLPLFTKHLFTADSGNLGLFTSGNIWSSGSLPLIMTTTYADSGSLNLYASGLYRATANMNLVAFNNLEWAPHPSALYLTTCGSSPDAVGMFNKVNLFALAEDGTVAGGSSNSSVNLHALGSPTITSVYSDSAMNLYISSPTVLEETLPLVLFGDGRISDDSTSENMQLFTSSYSSAAGATSFMWNGQNYGGNIVVSSDVRNDDEFYTSILSNDEIRGVDLIGFGSCESDSPKKIDRQSMVSHGTEWSPLSCIDAGISRAHSTYTNIDVGYSGHFYGIVKQSGLQPNTVFNMTMQGRSGSSNKVDLPRMWEEWEYGICGPTHHADSCCGDDTCQEEIAFSGVKFVGDYPYMSGDALLNPPSGRNAYDKFGHAVSVDNTTMAISAPYQEIADEYGSGLVDAGAIFVYDRQAQSYGGSKAPWHMTQKLTLPSGFVGDYSLPHTSAITFPGMPAIQDRKWQVGQEGREFGYSLDLTKGSGLDAREVVVVGAPGARWSRTFEEISTTPIPVCVLVVSDEFSYSDNQGSDIEAEVRYWDKLYKYYASDPAELNLKVVVAQPTGIFGGFSQQGALPDFISHQKIGRNNLNTTSEIYEGLRSAFHKAWPYDATKTYNNIPCVLGIYVDSSRSLGRDAVEPAIDMFKDYYRQYSHLSGVQDTDGVVDTGHLYEYFPDSPDETEEHREGDSSLSEDWVGMSKKIISNTLDTGRLIENNALRFITGGIGAQYANLDATAFNIPPDSGGRVYIFERPSGNNNFELIQEIKTGNDVTWDAKDRFGHSVSVSKDSSTVLIGSPYTEQSCLAYKHDSLAIDSLYSGLENWLSSKGTQFTVEIDRLKSYQGEMSKTAAAKKLYNELSPSGKWQARVDLDINEYKKVFAYGYSSIPYQGGWKFIADEYAPISRLGYSTAVDSNGSDIAFGAPTDSFNEFDDLNVWYKNKGDTRDGLLPKTGLWASTTNAGAVRIFTGRDYYQHNKAVEFTRFGNLDRNAHTVNNVEPAHYSDLNNIFHGNGVPSFSRTEYSDNKIPNEAGLAFIITPQIDASSDEVIDNIKDWLSLGDRTLVLVGNDPVWEENGRYAESNKIVNKILEKLDSRMRIHPARNKYESLPSCAPEGKPNVASAYRTQGARSSSLMQFSGPLYAKGVGDIRIHIPDFGTKTSPCEDGSSPATPVLNDKCNMWLQHNGDLRAEWVESCVAGSKCNLSLKYQRNWSLEFGTSVPNCCDPIQTHVNKPGQEPLAILTAAEYIPERVTVIPATEGHYEPTEQCTKHYIEIPANEKYLDFAEENLAEVQFTWSEAGFDGSNFLIDSFNNPDTFEGRDSVLSKKVSSNIRTVTKTRTILDPLPLVGEEKFEGSKVVMIASLTPENQESMLFGDDHTVSFYLNLVAKNCTEKGRILQLGGWTGRDSFKSANPDSVLKKLFDVTGNPATENWKSNLNTYHNVAWVANATGLPSESEAEDIKSWLGTGGKTLVITYDSSLTSARNAHNLCKTLGLTMSPVFSESDGEYKKSVLRYGSSPYVGNVDSSNSIIKGCSEKETVSKFAVQNSSQESSDLYTQEEYFYPIQNSNKVLWLNGQVTESYEDASDQKFYLKTGVARADFDVLPGSGYRIFYNWVSETPSEIMPLRFYASGVSLDVNLKNAGEAQVKDLDSKQRLVNRFDVNLKQDMDSPGILGQIKQEYVDIRIPEDVNKITLCVEGNQSLPITSPSSVNSQTSTTRFFAASGCLLPVLEKVKSYTQKKFSHTTCEKSEVFIEGDPETVVITPEQFRPIKTNHLKYCVGYSSDTTVDEHVPSEYERFIQGQLPDAEEFAKRDEDYGADDGYCGKSNIEIEDGPVIVAEEPEVFSAFVNGEKRSTIVVISDSSIVQGDCDFYRARNAAFILGLYPKNPLENTNDFDPISLGDSTTTDNYNKSAELFQGTVYTEKQKLMAPDRGSPHKFKAAAAHLSYINEEGSGLLAKKFDGATFTTVPGTSSFYDLENNYLPGDVIRPDEPETDEERRAALQAFLSSIIPAVGAAPCFSGGIDGYENYGDATIGRVGMPRLMKETGYDYVDFDAYPSGYPGDLFGYSIAMHNDRLIVGGPFDGFDGEDIVTWSGIKENPSGLKISGNGGAGAVYYFERTGKGSTLAGDNQKWQYISKIKPSSINAGYDGWTNPSNPDADDVLGDNDYTAEHLADAYITDQFGYSVSIDEDFIAIGAPGHDFDVYHEHIYGREQDGISYDGSFLRKEFDFEFDIPLHNVYDLGSSGMRDSVPSGNVVLNNGAVYTYVYDVIDSGQSVNLEWPRREKAWQYAEKVLAQGYGARSGVYAYDDGGTVVYASGSENDMFGKSVCIDRVYNRGDADYTLLAGATNHKYGASGQADTMLDAGSAYSFDAMLRRQTPAFASTEGYMTATIGLTGSGGLPSPATERFGMTILQSNGLDKTYQVSGLALSSPEGEIFLEVSGTDPSLKGFAEHRPFIEFVRGDMAIGTPANSYMSLYTDGQIPAPSSAINLNISGSGFLNVYNNMNLYSADGVSGITDSSWTYPGMYLYLATNEHQSSGSLNLFIADPKELDNSLNLRIRGK